MATNSQNSYPITANTVPTDRECVKNLTEILQGVEDFCQVSGLGGTSGNSFPTQDSVGEQAYQLATQLQAQVAALQAAQLTTRQSAGFAAVPAGTNDIPIQWSNPLPGSNYQVNITFQAVDGATISSAFNWYVVQGSQTTTGCTIRFVSAPAASAGLTFAWSATMLNSASTTLTISGFSPTSGTAGTTNVTIYGVGFTGTQAVTFNGVSATFTVVSDNQITTTCPTGATTGAIGVTNSTTTAYSSTSFTVS